MTPRNYFLILLDKIKCLLGFHDWVMRDDFGNEYCWNCHKRRDK
jgi:hypothetical protein